MVEKTYPGHNRDQSFWRQNQSTTFNAVTFPHIYNISQHDTAGIAENRREFKWYIILDEIISIGVSDGQTDHFIWFQ